MDGWKESKKRRKGGNEKEREMDRHEKKGKLTASTLSNSHDRKHETSVFLIIIKQIVLLFLRLFFSYHLQCRAQTDNSEVDLSEVSFSVWQ